MQVFDKYDQAIIVVYPAGGTDRRRCWVTALHTHRVLAWRGYHPGDKFASQVTLAHRVRFGATIGSAPLPPLARSCRVGVGTKKSFLPFSPWWSAPASLDSTPPHNARTPANCNAPGSRPPHLLPPTQTTQPNQPKKTTHTTPVARGRYCLCCTRFAAFLLGDSHRHDFRHSSRHGHTKPVGGARSPPDQRPPTTTTPTTATNSRACARADDDR